jgi:hypothetical protein
MAGGERLYRDLFWFGMPGGHWLLAGAFSVFGASIAVAEVTMTSSTPSGGADLRRRPRPRSVRSRGAAGAGVLAAQPAWPA